MERAVVKGDLEIHDRITGEETFHGRILDPLVDSRYVLAGYDATDDLVFENIPFATREGRHLYPAVAVLSASTRLLLVLPLDLDAAPDRLQIRHFRSFQQYVHIELPLHFLDDDIEV